MLRILRLLSVFPGTYLQALEQLGCLSCVSSLIAETVEEKKVFPLSFIVEFLAETLFYLGHFISGYLSRLKYLHCSCCNSRLSLKAHNAKLWSLDMKGCYPQLPEAVRKQ